MGGGLSGVACAWLLDGVADSFLFESRSPLGGHAHTIPVSVGGETLFVDVGAQFFAPGPHPTYSRLLELIGLTSPGNPADDATIEAEMSITVTEIQPLPGGGFTIANEAGAVETVDVAILATPPYVTRSLLPRRPALLEARALIERFGYFHAEISIHRDPAYMPGRRLYWSAYNPILAGAYCEASIWYGALRPVPPGQAPLMLFKSWATARELSPRAELFRREFLHPRITPDFIRAQGRLAPLQGREDLWFAGSYTLPVDSQESALVSAMNVVRELDPEAPNLVALES